MVSHYSDPVLTERVSVIIPFRFIVGPFVRDVHRFIKDSGFHQSECVVATKLDHLRGMCFNDRPGRPPNMGWETWWLASHWPLATRQDIRRHNELYAYYRYVCGADIRHWWT